VLDNNSVELPGMNAQFDFESSDEEVLFQDECESTLNTD